MGLLQVSARGPVVDRRGEGQGLGGGLAGHLLMGTAAWPTASILVGQRGEEDFSHGHVSGTTFKEGPS